METRAGHHPDLAHARARRRARAGPRRRRLPDQALQPRRARCPHPPPHRTKRTRTKGTFTLISAILTASARLGIKVNVPLVVPWVIAAMFLAPQALACDTALEESVAASPDDTDARDA